MNDTGLIGIFCVVIVLLLLLDLFVLNRKPHEMGTKESLLWSAFWASLALIFCTGVHTFRGHEPAITWLTAYLVEMSLSIDNLFVFLLVFKSFRVPQPLQHRVLFWGILGALVMRAICIVAGIAALQKLHWLMYVFGVILIYSGIKTALEKDEEEEDQTGGFASRMAKKLLPVTENYDGAKFLTKVDGKTFATPLFLALVVIEFSDVLFAVDSIPAVLSISRDTFIVYTSNVFAILGLRSFYFALAHVASMFRYLKYGLSAVLIFIGLKMLLVEFVHVAPTSSLAAIVVIIGVSIAASVLNQGEGT